MPLRRRCSHFTPLPVKKRNSTLLALHDRQRRHDDSLIWSTADLAAADVEDDAAPSSSKAALKSEDGWLEQRFLRQPDRRYFLPCLFLPKVSLRMQSSGNY